MSVSQIKITNGIIIAPGKIIKNGTMLITDGKITGVSERDIDAPEAVIIDAGGKYVSPGFIDIHVHGGGGHDFMDATETAFLKIAEIHARYGTTSMLPTTLTSSKEEILETLESYEAANKKNLNGSQFLGVHLEGPYFA